MRGFHFQKFYAMTEQVAVGDVFLTADALERFYGASIRDITDVVLGHFEEEIKKYDTEEEKRRDAIMHDEKMKEEEKKMKLEKKRQRSVVAVMTKWCSRRAKIRYTYEFVEAMMMACSDYHIAERFFDVFHDYINDDIAAVLADRLRWVRRSNDHINIKYCRDFSEYLR